MRNSRRCTTWLGARSEIAVPCLRPSATGREDGSGLTRRLAMALRIICMYGYVIQGDDDDKFWGNADHIGICTTDWLAT